MTVLSVPRDGRHDPRAACDNDAGSEIIVDFIYYSCRAVGLANGMWPRPPLSIAPWGGRPAVLIEHAKEPRTDGTEMIFIHHMVFIFSMRMFLRSVISMRCTRLAHDAGHARPSLRLAIVHRRKAPIAIECEARRQRQR